MVARAQDFSRNAQRAGHRGTMVDPSMKALPSRMLRWDSALRLKYFSRYAQRAGLGAETRIDRSRRLSVIVPHAPLGLCIAAQVFKPLRAACGTGCRDTD